MKNEGNINSIQNLKNETILQKYLKSAFNKELSLLLNCHTRWNSLLKMLEGFALLKMPIQEALRGLYYPVAINEADVQLIKDLVDNTSKISSRSSLTFRC